MNNIYVDFNELDVEDRPHYKCNKYILQVKSINSGSKYENIKLISLTDRLAEERKKVIERIRDLAEIYTEPSSKGFDFDTYILTEENLNNILDKAERGSYEDN